MIAENRRENSGRIGTQIKLDPRRLMALRHARSADLLKA